MAAITESRPDSDFETIEHLDESFEIACEIPKIKRDQGKTGWPSCLGNPAIWVAWRVNCCPQSPRYRLICDFCKSTYQNWQAKHGYIACALCGEETGGFVAYTLLNKDSA